MVHHLHDIPSYLSSLVPQYHLTYILGQGIKVKRVSNRQWQRQIHSTARKPYTPVQNCNKESAAFCHIIG